MTKIQNAQWDFRGDSVQWTTVTLNFDYNGARHHVWLDPVTGQNREDVLYRNPPLGLKRGQLGHFTTRRLDATAHVNAALIAEARELAGNFGAALRKHEDAIAAANETRESKAAALARAERVRGAAPKLLDALKALLKECEKIEESRCQTFFWCDEARAAIADAEGPA